MTDSQAKPTSLGEFLRLEREKKGITIEQVASATRISTRILHSLEADHYSELPAKPFVRGFVTSYARFIGLDAKEILIQFNQFLDEKSHERPTHDEGHSGYAFERREGDQSRTILWFIMGGFLLLGGIVLLVLRPSLKHHRTAHIDRLKTAHGIPNTEAPAITPTPSPLSSAAPASKLDTKAEHNKPGPQPSPSPLATTAKEDPNDPLNSGANLNKEEIKHKIIFRALDDIWVRFQVDDRKPMRFILRKDKVLILRAKDTVRFQSSDPKSVRYSYNGQTPKVFAEDSKAAFKKGDLTLFIPSQLSEIIDEPFKDARLINKMPVPPAPSPRPQPTSTQ